MKTIRVALGVMLCFMFFGVCYTPKVCADETIENVRLTLEHEVFSDGVVEVLLNITSSDGVCGLLAVLEYDPSALVLMSCGVGEDNMSDLTFTFREEKGRVIFLVDGKKNSVPCGTLASFYFRIADENASSAYVGLLPIEKESAFCLIDEAGLREVFPDISCARTNIIMNQEQDSAEDLVVNTIEAVTIKRDDDELIINVVGNVMDSRCFAVGYKMFFVNVHDATDSTVIVARMADAKFARFAVSAPFATRVCVIITPLSYNGREIIEGAKQVFLFE